MLVFQNSCEKQTRILNNDILLWSKRIEYFEYLKKQQHHKY